MLERRGHWLLGVLALVLYAPSLANGLTSWDDPTYTFASPFVTNGLAGLAQAFTGPYDGAYIPLSHAVLTLAGAAAPANPLPYHLVQWLLFGLAVALTPLALEALTVPRRVALLATALWLAHPFRVESAAWVANLKDTLSLLLLAAALAVVGRGHRWASALLYALGLLAKASLAPLAPLFLWLEWRRVGPARGLASSLRWLVPGLAAGVLAVLVHRFPSTAAASRSDWTTPLVTPFWYLARTLWPAGPRAIYAWSAPGPAWLGVAAVGVVALLAVLALGLRPRASAGQRALALGVGFSLLPLLPFTGVVAQAHPVAERYTLFPSLGLAVGLATLLLRLGLAGLTVGAALVVALGSATVLRVREWRDGLTLWTSNVALTPTSTAALINLAGAQGGAGDFGAALTTLHRVRDLEPTTPGLDCYVAIARAGAEKLEPGFAVTELGALCRLPSSQRWAAAVPIIARRDATSRVVLEELAFGSDRPKAAAAAAALALEKDELERALALATQARLWDPTQERALITQVLALVKLKRLEEAFALSQSEVKDPLVAARLLGLRGVVLNEQGQFAEAEALLRQSTEQLRALGERP